MKNLMLLVLNHSLSLCSPTWFEHSVQQAWVGHRMEMKVCV